MHAAAPGLAHVSAERIGGGIKADAQGELSKLLLGRKPARALFLARDTGVLTRVIPEFAPAIGFSLGSDRQPLPLDEHLFAVAQIAADNGYEARGAARRPAPRSRQATRRGRRRRPSAHRRCARRRDPGAPPLPDPRSASRRLDRRPPRLQARPSARRPRCPALPGRARRCARPRPDRPQAGRPRREETSPPPSWSASRSCDGW